MGYTGLHYCTKTYACFEFSTTTNDWQNNKTKPAKNEWREVENICRTNENMPFTPILFVIY